MTGPPGWAPWSSSRCAGRYRTVAVALECHELNRGSKGRRKLWVRPETSAGRMPRTELGSTASPCKRQRAPLAPRWSPFRSRWCWATLSGLKVPPGSYDQPTVVRTCRITHRTQTSPTSSRSSKGGLPNPFVVGSAPETSTWNEALNAAANTCRKLRDPFLLIRPGPHHDPRLHRPDLQPCSVRPTDLNLDPNLDILSLPTKSPPTRKCQGASCPSPKPCCCCCRVSTFPHWSLRSRKSVPEGGSAQ
jgi:hypothetical protein